MQIRRQIAMAAALVMFGSFATAHAQQDLKPLQADVDALKPQVSRLQTDLSLGQPKNPPPQTPTKPTRTAPEPKATNTVGAPKAAERTSPAPQ